MSTNAITGDKIASLPASTLEVWKVHLAVLAAVLLALGAALFTDVNAAWNVWWNYPAYSHCYLIIPISAWLIWEKRASVLADTPAPSPSALALALPLVALWLVGRFGSVTEFRQYALVGLAEVFIIAILGWHIFRRISFACLYLFFLVPTGQYLIPPLQDITARFVEHGLTLFGVNFFRNGLIFELVNGRYEIAEACAGLRFLVATVALGALFAHMMYRKVYKIVIFMLACFIVPVIGNGIRALLTVTVANYTNNKVAAGFDHIVYGWVFAVAIIFGIMYVGARFRDPEADAPPAPPSKRGLHYPALLATALGALALLSLGPALAYRADRQPDTADQAALDSLAQMPGWEHRDFAGDWSVNFAPSALQFETAIAQGSQAPVEIDVRYYIRNRGTSSLVSSRNHPWNQMFWHDSQHRSLTETVSGAVIPLEEAVIDYNEKRRLEWVTYWVDGRFTTSPPLVRLLEFQAGITHGHSAVIALSTPVTSTSEDARARLRVALAALPDLPGVLRKAGDAPAQSR